MKFLICVFTLAFCLMGCEKVFKEDPQNNLRLNSISDYEEAMAGLYNRLFYSIMGNLVIHITSISNEDDLHVFPRYSNTEDLNLFIEFGTYGNIFSSCTGCGIDNFDYIYHLYYQTIGITNDILSKAGNIENLDFRLRKIIGEVYYVRAYTYFRLTRLYGQVAIVDNPDVEFSLKKASFASLYQFIEKDLLKAIDLLPKNNLEARIKYETPHRGTAKALLAEVYLTMGGAPLNDNTKYADAARVAKEIIDSATFYDFRLLPDLADLWNGKYSRNAESVFSFFITDSTKDLSHGLDSYNNELYVFSGKGGLGGPYNNSPCTRYSDIIAAPDFYNTFPKNYRKEVSFQTRHVPNNYDFAWDQVNHTYKIFFDSLYLKHYDTINYSTDIAYKKFYTQFSVPDSVLLKGGHMNTSFYGHYTGGTIYIFRYAQTLLTYAEAKARIGEADASAYEAINQVRRRANKTDLFSASAFDLTPGLPQSQFLDSVIQERAWELCAEPEGRWFDIMRLGLTNKLAEIKHKQKIFVYPIPTQNNNFYLPIPEDEQFSE